MNKVSRLIIFLSSIIVFSSIFGRYIHPDFAWYQLTFLKFLEHKISKVQIFSTGYTFTFNIPFLSDKEIIEMIFTSPSYIYANLHYFPILILASNILVMISSLMNNRLLSLLSSSSLLILILLINSALNLWIKDIFYPIRTSWGPLLAGSAASIATLLALLTPKDK